MALVKSDDRLWTPARLAMKGAYSSTDGVPPTGDLKDILDFLLHQISPPPGVTIPNEPVYHAFRSIVINAGVETHRGLAAYGFDIPFLIDAMIQLLSNKVHIPLQRMSLLILPELDGLLFKSEAAFKDGDRAERFVKAWSTAVNQFLHGAAVPQTDVASVKVLLAIANLPCLRGYLLPEHWNLVYKFPIILYSDSPSMQRCIENPDILPFIKKPTDDTSTLGWLGMLWMKYHSLSKEVRGQLEAETRAIGSSPRHFDLDSYTSMFSWELDRLQARINGLEPLDLSVPGLRSELDEMTRARDRLVEIQKEERLPASKSKEQQLSPQPKEQRKSSQPRTLFGISL